MYNYIVHVVSCLAQLAACEPKAHNRLHGYYVINIVNTWIYNYPTPLNLVFYHSLHLPIPISLYPLYPFISFSICQIYIVLLFPTYHTIFTFLIYPSFHYVVIYTLSILCKNYKYIVYLYNIQ